MNYSHVVAPASKSVLILGGVCLYTASSHHCEQCTLFHLLVYNVMQTIIYDVNSTMH